jgi:hypothetical protein
MSYMSNEERDEILQKILNKNKNQLDDAMNLTGVRIDANVREYYNNKFNQEIQEYEECMKKGEYLKAAFHYDLAKSINEYMKKARI